MRAPGVHWVGRPVLLLLAGCELNLGVVGTLPEGDPSLQRLVLRHGATREPLMELTAGAILDLAKLPTRSFNVEAESGSSSARIGSVSFAINGQPHSLDDSAAFELEAWAPVPGAYRIEATPHALAGGEGRAGPGLEVDVQVIEALAPPSAPSGLTASATQCARVTLSWQPSSGGASISAYRLYRDGALLREVAGTTATDDTVSGGGSYAYQVSALDNLGRESARSSEANVTTPACADTTAPSAPASPTASAASCNLVNLSWQASTDTGGSGLKGYNVYRGGTFLKQVLAPAASTTDSGVAGATAQAYRVSAVDNANNESAQSATANATTPACPGGGLLGAVSTTTVTVGTGSIASNTHNEYGPYLAMLPDGRAKLAWCDSTAKKVYVRHLDATLATAERADTVLDGFKLCRHPGRKLRLGLHQRLHGDPHRLQLRREQRLEQPPLQRLERLARLRSYLLGWVTSDSTSSDFSAGTHFWIAEVSSTGTLLAGPQEITSVASFSYGSTWATVTATGDVVWPLRTSATSIRIVRVAR